MKKFPADCPPLRHHLTGVVLARQQIFYGLWQANETRSVLTMSGQEFGVEPAMKQTEGVMKRQSFSVNSIIAVPVILPLSVTPLIVPLNSRRLITEFFQPFRNRYFS